MRILLFICLPGVLWAQDRRWEWGATAGLTLRPDPAGNENRAGTGGLRAQYHFTRHISLIANPLYHRTGFRQGLAFPNNQSAELPERVDSRVRGDQLELPLLLQYTFGQNRQRWRPFVSTGYAVGITWERYETTQTFPGATRRFVGHSTASSSGLIWGAGVEKSWGRLKWSPELRYSFHSPRWSNFEGRHRLDFLVSLSF